MAAERSSGPQHGKEGNVRKEAGGAIVRVKSQEGQNTLGLPTSLFTVPTMVGGSWEGPYLEAYLVPNYPGAEYST